MRAQTVEISVWWIVGSIAAGAIASMVAGWMSFRKEKRRAKEQREEREAKARGAEPSALAGFGDLVESLWMAINLSPPVDREKLYGSVLSRFAGWVGDLPASESYHHSERGGLLQHSLESALGAVRRVGDMHLRYYDAAGEEDPVTAYRASEVWRYAAFLFGLFHDIGKCVSVMVTGPGGEIWNPFAEAFGGFVERVGGRQRVEVKFVPGRGLAEHQALTEWMMGRILPEEAVAFARRFGVLEDILKTAHGYAVVGARGENARQFLERVKGGDSASVDRYVRQQPAASASAVAPSGRPERVEGLLWASLERALGGKVLEANTPAGDVYVGTKFLCAVYPDSFGKLIDVMKREYPDEPDVRGLDGPRELVSLLSLKTGAVYREPKDGFWKFRFKADFGPDVPAVRDGEAVLLFLEKLPQTCRETIARIGTVPAGWSFRFFAKAGELAIGDLEGGRGGGYDGHSILAALKEALLSGRLSASPPVRQVFVTPKAAHFVVPACLDAIFGREEVARAWNLNRMLDAMMRTGAVVPGPGGRAVVTIQVGSMKGTVDVVAIDSGKLFTWQELAKLEADGKTCVDPIRLVEKISA